MEKVKGALVSHRLKVHLVRLIIILIGSRSSTCFSVVKSTQVAVNKNSFCLGMREMSEHDFIAIRKESAEEGYLKYVHKSIREILDADPTDVPSSFKEEYNSREDGLVFVNAESCLIQWDIFEEYMKWGDSRSSIAMDDLLTLALQCEKGLFRERTVPSNIPLSIHGLIDVSGIMDDNGPVIKEKILVATLLSLNMVESSIRNLSGQKHGRAPLLKDMIQMIAEDEDLSLPTSLPMLLRALLLPNDGINLRNLLWHGFVPGIKKHWLALSIILTLSIDDIAQNAGLPSITDDQSDDNLDGLDAMRSHPMLVQILDHGQSTISSAKRTEALNRKLMASSFIPDTHKELTQVSLEFVQSPVIFASVAGPLIEHSLRLWWCDVNGRHQDAIARPGSYYVTLDGHGQRDKHDVVLLPYLSPDDGVELILDSVDTNSRETIRDNKLIDKIGKNKMDLLVDLFASPPGSPNIRASVAHGSFNRHLYDELSRRNQIDVLISPTLRVQDMTYALIAVLDLIGSTGQSGNQNNLTGNGSNLTIESYRPIFSYSASLLREIDNVIDALDTLYAMVADGNQIFHTTASSQSELQRNVSRDLQTFPADLEMIRSSKARILKACDRDTSSRDYSVNIIAADCGAANLLLAEIAHAVDSYVGQVKDAFEETESSVNQPSSRRRKQISRLLSMAQVNIDFYSFAAFCALLFVEKRFVPTSKFEYPNLKEEDLFLAVKRSRMVVSTFSTAAMMDRALKAVDNYTKGKAVKVIAAEISNKRLHAK